MPLVCVGDMRMVVHQMGVPVLVAVRFDRRFVKSMRVSMVLIMLVHMRVRHRFVVVKV